MGWIVGIDFEGRSHGALHMAAWLRAHLTAPAAPEFTAVHVLAESRRRGHARDVVAALPGHTLEYMRQLLTTVGLADTIGSLHVEWAPAAEEGLVNAAASLQAEGIVIGRAAKIHEHALVRLGRVARRLLRHLTVPVMVVPPDLRASDIGGGPIVFATDLGPASLAAGRVALALAESCARPLWAVAIDDTLYASLTGSPELMPLSMYVPRRSVDEVREWTQSHGLAAAHPHLAEGDRVGTLLAMARDQNAPLIVCGSRCLSLSDRIFASSMASELASMAHCPVLVVPGA